MSADTLTIATIIAPDAPIYEQQAVEAVVARFIEIKNAGTRNDVARAAAAERHEFGVNRYRAYRRWEHTFWHLRGEPSTWHAQLESLYAEATPFALVSGAAGNLWSVIHQFCEDHQLPCVLPAGDAPGADDSDFYSLYFSSGVTLEAEVAAKHLATVRADDAKQVLLVHSDDESGNAAAAAFKRLWPAKQGAVAEVPLRAGMIPKSTRWRTYLTGKPTRFVVAFVSPGQLQSLMRALAGQEHAPELVYTAESMSSWASMTENMPLLTRIMHVYPYALSTGEQGQFAREEEWLRSQGLGSMEEISAAKALFACHVFGEAMSDIKTNLSRDYLMESFEHALDGTQMTSIYPRTTMGPSQRLLARGAYVTGIVPDSAGNRLVSVEWIQP